MASLAKSYSQEKLFGQVYTPDFVVCKILDDVGYDSPDILGRAIIDPACGDGRFLSEVVRRIIKFSPASDLKKNLECVWGWDIDSVAVVLCIENLNGLIKPLEVNVKWNISVEDSIKKLRKHDLFTSASGRKFDFIVGNPPYIRIQHLDLEQRTYIQTSYDFCRSGSTDMYIAFYELCLNLLSDNGVCGLITPNTFLFTSTASPLRQHFLRNRNLVQITNYGDIQLFGEATTYSAITIFNSRRNENFKFQKASSETTFEERVVDFAELGEPFWQLTINKTEDIEGRKLGEICNIHVGIVTLCDSAYIFPVEVIDENFVWAETKLRGRVKIERAILKPIIKGSKLKKSEDEIREHVIFPYRRSAGKVAIIEEQTLRDSFPLTYDYLLSVRTELDRRDNGKPNPVAWYAFGRSQGLETSFGEKIIFSPMNDKPNFVFYPDPECTFYSGYCIKKVDGLSVEQLLRQLNSERMDEFVSMSSRDFRGGWKAYNKRVIENFVVEMRTV